MADRYGPVFTIQLGTKQALVVSNRDVAKEIFATNDQAFSDRPISIALKIMGYNNALFAFAPYGQYWCELRKIVVFELLSNRRLESLKHIWNSEIEGYQKEMKNLAMELDSLVQGLLEEHKRKRGSEEGSEAKKQHDFMDVMLSVLNDTTVIADRDADTVNKATCLTIILGASDTTTVTLTWALSLLLNNLLVVKKAQEEVTAQVGSDRHVDESDVKNQEYLQAIIKETLRLYPAAPLSVPRESIEDAVVAGYHVPPACSLS
ncbi:hypothetical protein Sjap_017090 [Stephania japonica]|uniref:Cytochrome P450 n=1 Tax=Stephania japonica TaxID=461633 RepID=A0AAP0NJY7_9MAGN